MLAWCGKKTIFGFFLLQPSLLKNIPTDSAKLIIHLRSFDEEA